MARIIFGLIVLFMSGFTHAQCPAGIPSGGNPNCLPPDVLYGNQGVGQSQNAPSQQPIVIRHKWADRWGAIIYDKVKPVIGTSQGLSSKRKAIASAVADCKAKGGGVR